MMGDPLKTEVALLDYQVIKFSLDMSRVKAREFEIEVGLQVGVGPKPNSDVDYRLDLGIDIRGKEPQSPDSGFAMTLQLAGFFRVQEHVEKTRRQEVVALNGVSTLYGTARAIVAGLTSQSPTGKFILPAINVLELLRSNDASPGAKTPARNE